MRVVSEDMERPGAEQPGSMPKGLKPALQPEPCATLTVLSTAPEKRRPLETASAVTLPWCLSSVWVQIMLSMLHTWNTPKEASYRRFRWSSRFLSAQALNPAAHLGFFFFQELLNPKTPIKLHNRCQWAKQTVKMAELRLIWSLEQQHSP